MESRRTRVTVPGAGDTRERVLRRALPLALVGLAVTAVAVVGEGGGVGRAHYLRQLVFGPAGPHAARPAVRTRDERDATPVVPAIPSRGGAARR
ncbi:MAG TPA: hypothetical protein VFG42_27035 [Baekduia sp.]|uniref:hypothetical protein n=1 Tax=Baekduia sp. TaxID=2600305 RepID=UPI002D776494|nr:hypothetical protein [Baekduia sp.]HET6510480.1 hypothetical protein [Baekduia sp.]